MLAARTRSGEARQRREARCRASTPRTSRGTPRIGTSSARSTPPGWQRAHRFSSDTGPVEMCPQHVYSGWLSAATDFPNRRQVTRQCWTSGQSRLKNTTASGLTSYPVKREATLIFRGGTIWWRLRRCDSWLGETRASGVERVRRALPRRKCGGARVCLSCTWAASRPAASGYLSETVEPLEYWGRSLFSATRADMPGSRYSLRRQPGSTRCSCPRGPRVASRW